MIATLGCMAGWFARALASVAVLAVLVTSALSGMSAWADGVVLSQPVAETRPEPAQASYDETQPGADDPRVKEGFAAYQAGDFKKAYALWLPPAEAGNAEAQFRIGRLYDFGEGVEKNDVQTVFWYDAATKQSHTSAAFNLGLHFTIKDEKLINQVKAISYYLIAANNNDIEAQHSLGVMYAVITPPHRDLVEAYKWLYIAEKSGRLEATRTIRKLDAITDKQDQVLAKEKMREWFENHPRFKPQN